MKLGFLRWWTDYWWVCNICGKHIPPYEDHKHS